MKPDKTFLIKCGSKVKAKDGEQGTVKGCFMSEEGIVLTVQTAPDRAACRNVPLKDVEDLLDA